MVTTRTPSARPNGGGVETGMDGARYVASTTRRRTFTGTCLPDTRDVARWSAPSVW